jgi:hypothetical protein
MISPHRFFFKIAYDFGNFNSLKERAFHWDFFSPEWNEGNTEPAVAPFVLKAVITKDTIRYLQKQSLICAIGSSNEIQF